MENANRNKQHHIYFDIYVFADGMNQKYFNLVSF